VKFVTVPVAAEAGPAMDSENELVMVIVTLAIFDGSALLVATTLTMGGATKICGAV